MLSDLALGRTPGRARTLRKRVYRFEKIGYIYSIKSNNMKKENLSIGTYYTLDKELNCENQTFPTDTNFEPGTIVQFLGYTEDPIVIVLKEYQGDDLEYTSKNVWAASLEEFLESVGSEVEIFD